MKPCKVDGCRKPCEPGLDVCLQHGGGWPQARRKSEMARIEQEMVNNGLAKPIPLEDDEANPAVAIHNEYRRTLGRIRYLESKVAELTEAELQFGLTKVETTTAGEFPGVTQTFESRIPVFEQMLDKERQHLVRLVNLMGKQSFQAAEIALRQRSEERALDLMESMVNDLVVALGRKPDDPRVRRALARVYTNALAEMPGDT